MIILSYHYSAAGAEDLDASAAGLGTFRKRTSLKIEEHRSVGLAGAFDVA